MKILAIDTSSNNCSVAILDNNNLIVEKHLEGEKTHSQKLIPLIQDILLEQNTNLLDINLLACSIGPGSFTGVRIGVSTVKAFNDVTNIPIVGISSLEGLAYNLLNSDFKNKSNDIVCSIIDAKNDNVYFRYI